MQKIVMFLCCLLFVFLTGCKKDGFNKPIECQGLTYKFVQSRWDFVDTSLRCAIIEKHKKHGFIIRPMEKIKYPGFYLLNLPQNWKEKYTDLLKMKGENESIYVQIKITKKIVSHALSKTNFWCAYNPEVDPCWSIENYIITEMFIGLTPKWKKFKLKEKW